MHRPRPIGNRTGRFGVSLAVDSVMARGNSARRAIDPVSIVAANPSFEGFYARTRAQVSRALALTLREMDLANEATDEAMARAFARWRTVQLLDNPAGWVYRVGLNWARSQLRRRGGPRRVVHEIDGAPFEAADPVLQAAIARLDLDRRAVVVCRFYLELSEQEIARALGIRPGTVKSRLHRALRQLSTDLRPTTSEEPS